MIDSRYLPPEALDQLGASLREWRAQLPASGVLLLLPEAEKARLPALQATFRQEGVPLVGAVFPALLTTSGFVTQGACVVRFETMPERFLLPDLDADAALAARRLAGAVQHHLATPDADEEAPTLFLVFDGMVANIGSILNHAALRLKHRVRYAGVNAGSESFQPMPCLFDAESVVGHGVLGLILPPGCCTAVRHGYPVASSEFRATSTEGNRIDRINGRPAFEVYREIIRNEYGIELTHENFYDHAVHFPFGVVGAVDVLVRIPVGFTAEGALFCIGEVPPYSVLRLLHAPALDDSCCLDEIAAMLGWQPGRQHESLLVFYCAGRRLHFGEQAAEELRRLEQKAGVSSLVGALSLGEIDTMDDLGLPRFHNASLVCVSDDCAGDT